MEASTNDLEVRRFRDALGLFPTGVAVITTTTEAGERLGATVSSFNSVSLDPPLILFSMAKSARALDLWLHAGQYAVNVLSQDQAGLSTRFARAHSDKWEGVLPLLGGNPRLPLLPNALAWFECVPFSHYDGGDHVIFVGRVDAFKMRSGTPQKPLVFFRGHYRHLADIAHEEVPKHDSLWLHGW